MTDMKCHIWNDTELEAGAQSRRTEAEILKQLIEIAWANGWKTIKGPREFRVSDEDVYFDFCIIQNEFEDDFTSPIIARHDDCESYDYATIIFDPELILALCLDRGAKERLIDNKTIEIDEHLGILQQLAIAPNRLEYLREQFLKEK